MSPGMFSREELNKFYGFDQTAGVDTQSTIAELFDDSHSLVADIGEALCKLAAAAPSDEDCTTTASLFTRTTPATSDALYTTFTGPVTGVPACPSTLIRSPSGFSYLWLSYPPLFVSPDHVNSLTGQSIPIMSSPTPPDPSPPPMAPSTPSTPRGNKRKLPPPTPEPSVNKRARG